MARFFLFTPALPFGNAAKLLCLFPNFWAAVRQSKRVSFALALHPKKHPLNKVLQICELFVTKLSYQTKKPPKWMALLRCVRHLCKLLSTTCLKRDFLHGSARVARLFWHFLYSNRIQRCGIFFAFFSRSFILAEYTSNIVLQVWCRVCLFRLCDITFFY